VAKPWNMGSPSIREWQKKIVSLCIAEKKNLNMKGMCAWFVYITGCTLCIYYRVYCSYILQDVVFAYKTECTVCIYYRK